MFLPDTIIPAALGLVQGGTRNLLGATARDPVTAREVVVYEA